jgi:serine/threonine-protein kinase
VYAAGCVLFELVVGHPPFVGDSPVSVAYQHVREDPRAPSDINHEVPPDVDAIVLKALAKNPLNRYQSAQEMRADALRAVAGRPVLATPVMTEAETMAMTGPRYLPQAAATTVNRPVPGGMPPRQADTKMSSWWTAVLAALGVLAVVALGIGLAISRNNDDNTPNTPAPVPMPNLIGKTDKEAQAALAAAGLTGIKAGPPDTGDNCGDNKGRVSKQDPAAATKIALTATGSYTICTGPQQVTVPSTLIGGTKDNAAAALSGIGLEPNFIAVDNKATKDQVLDVDHEGEKVDPGTKINVKVSRGNQLAMPDVVNQNVEAATAILENAGDFNVTTKIVQQPGTPGTVVSQNPAAKKTVTRGSSVTLEVIGDQNPDPSDSPDPGGSNPPGGGGGGPVGGLFAG